MLSNLLVTLSGLMLTKSDNETHRMIGSGLTVAGLVRLIDRIDGREGMTRLALVPRSRREEEVADDEIRRK